MKTTKAITLSTLIATIICAGLLINFLNTRADGATSKEITNGNSSNTGASRPATSPIINKLVSDKKISGHVIRSEVGRAFSISRTGPLRPSGNALDYVKDLLPASRAGDAVATYDIFLATLDCNNALRNAGAMYEEVIVDRDLPQPKTNPKLYKERLLECESLLTNDEIGAENWLKTAVKQGSIEAMIMYSVNPDHILGRVQDYAMKPELVQEWKDDSIKNLNLAASLGSTDALISLSDVYKQGVIAPADPIESYAYKLAALKATNSPPLQWEQLQNSSKLTQEQIHKATERSNAILEYCCK